MSRLRTAKVVLSSAFLGLAMTAAACGSEEADPDMEEVCIDTRGTSETNDDIRVDDDRCDDDRDGRHGGMFIWGYYPFGYAPGVGSPASSSGKSYSTTKSGVIGKSPAGGSSGSKGGSSGG